MRRKVFCFSIEEVLSRRTKARFRFGPSDGGKSMYEDEGYRFCPECGALMKNGKCMNCGYEEGVAQENGVNESDAPGFPENAAEGTQRQPEQNEHPKEGAFGQPENPFHEEQRPRNQGGSQPYTGQPPHAGAYYGQPDGQPNGGQGYGNQPGGGQPFYNQGYSGQPGNGQPPYHAPYSLMETKGTAARHMEIPFKEVRLMVIPLMEGARIMGRRDMASRDMHMAGKNRVKIIRF